MCTLIGVYNNNNKNNNNGLHNAGKDATLTRTYIVNLLLYASAVVRES